MVGYFYWGYLGDKKFNSEGQEVSTPDGNAFYSWSIIKALQDSGREVYLYSDRDKVGAEKMQMDLFKSFAQRARYDAYTDCVTECTNVESILDFVIVEWRWLIPGRNDKHTKETNPAGYQPDLEMMENIITSPTTPNNITIGEVPNFEDKVAEPIIDIIDSLNEGDCLIANDSRVLPARIYGIKDETGARVEFLLLRQEVLRMLSVLYQNVLISVILM